MERPTHTLQPNGICPTENLSPTSAPALLSSPKRTSGKPVPIDLRWLTDTYSDILPFRELER